MGRRVLLKNDKNEIIYPQTKASNVLIDGETLDKTLKKLNQNDQPISIIKTVLSSDWKDNTSSYVAATYSYEIIHGMDTSNIEVTLFNGASRISIKNIETNNTSVILYSDIKLELNALIENRRYIITSVDIDVLWNSIQ